MIEPTRVRWSPERKAFARRLHALGFTLKSIGERFGCTAKRVYDAVYAAPKRLYKTGQERTVWGVVGTRTDGSRLFFGVFSREAQARKRADVLTRGGVEATVTVERMCGRDDGKEAANGPIETPAQ